VKAGDVLHAVQKEVGDVGPGPDVVIVANAGTSNDNF
jgi:hypothetical protein